MLVCLKKLIHVNRFQTVSLGLDDLERRTFTPISVKKSRNAIFYCMPFIIKLRKEIIYGDFNTLYKLLLRHLTIKPYH